MQSYNTQRKLLKISRILIGSIFAMAPSKSLNWIHLIKNPKVWFSVPLKQSPLGLRLSQNARSQDKTQATIPGDEV